MSGHRFEPSTGKDPFTLFFKGFSNSVKPSEISDYFHDKGYQNRITYQKSYPQHFRMFMALRFERKQFAQEIFEKYSNKILFGYKVHVSFFKKKIVRTNNNNIFMQDKLRKLRAQATRRPFFFKSRFNNGHHTPTHSFKARSWRRGRSSSSDSNRSISPERKRRTRSREMSANKRRRRHSRSHSHSSRSTSRSPTPPRTTPASSSSKRPSADRSSSEVVRQLPSKVTVVDRSAKKSSRSRSGSRSSKERSQDSPAKKAPAVAALPSKELLFMRNFSPVSFGSDDDAMLMTPSPSERNLGRDAEPEIGRAEPPQPPPSSSDSYPSPQKAGQAAAGTWGSSEGEFVSEAGARSPQDSGVARGSRQCPKGGQSECGKAGSSLTEIKGLDRPWLLKPLTVQGGGGGAGLVAAAASSSHSKSPSHSVGDGSSPSSLQLQSPTSSFGASSPKLNGGAGQKRRYSGSAEVNQSKMERLQAKKEEIIKAYKQDCDTFATVVRMLIRKDPELEPRLQRALSENLTEIGQRCVQELQDMVDQMKE